MITRKVQVYCIDRESHSITLTEGGALHFHNHPNVKELENFLRLEQIGGPACTCARFLEHWRKKEHQKLPDRLQAMHTERFQSAGILRLLKRYQRRRPLPCRVWFKDNAGPVHKEEYSDKFLGAVVSELDLRGHSLEYTFTTTPSRIVSVHDNPVRVDARFKSNIVMSVQVDSPWGTWSGNVVPGKNGNIAVREAADRVELFLLRSWLFRPKPKAHFDETIKEYLAENPSELISAGRSVEKMPWECFGTHVPSISFVVSLKVHPLTEEAAIVATCLLREIEPKLLALQRASTQRFDKLNIELEETIDDV